MTFQDALEPRAVLKMLVDVVRDIGTFGPGILLRHLYAHDDRGAVSIKTKIGRLNLRPNDTDLEALREVFVKRDYDFGRFPQMARVRAAYDAILAGGRVPIIVDAGANIGAASMWFAREFPKAKVFSIEPDPDNVSLCRRNCETYGNIEVVEAAIGSEAGHVRLVSESNESWGVRTERGSDAGVPVLTIDDIVNKGGEDGRLFIVKIDIEGFESDLFSANISWMSAPDVIMIELHDWMLPGHYSSGSFQKAMLPFKFELLNLNSNLVFIR